jgi:hypothetical protein
MPRLLGFTELIRAYSEIIMGMLKLSPERAKGRDN